MPLRRSLPLLLVFALFVVTAVPSAMAAPPQPDRAPDWSAPSAASELIVDMPTGGRAALARAGVQVVRETPQLGLALVRVPSGRALANAVADLEAAGIAWAEPNYTFTLDKAPNDPHYPTQSLYLDRIDASAAWDITTGRPEIVIAILDTGVDTDHADLRDGIWRNPGEIPGNGLDDEGNGFIDDVQGWDFAANENDARDDHGHGTHVAGIAVARIDNEIGIAGLAGRATVMPVDVFGGGIGTYEDLIRAIVYATDNGAHVINMSLGASSYSRGEEAAVNYAHSRGVVLVAAAGNTGSGERSEQLHYPAAHENVIAVASTQADDGLSGFSTRGDFVDVAAPGSGIYSTYPGGYGYMSGTSMATPHVAGLAALILSRNPSLTPHQVRAAIETAVDDLGPVGRDIYYGLGRVNAARAVAAVGPSDQLPPTPAPGDRLNLDLPGCREIIVNGGFESGLTGWQAGGAIRIDKAVRDVGAASAHFPGGPNARGVLTQTVTIPKDARLAVLDFAYRIDPQDGGEGASPDWPFDDWFTVEWRSTTGELLTELLRTGNTADTVSDGLQWDEYYYRLTLADMDALRSRGAVSLVFTSQNDADTAATPVWVDRVRFCALDLPLRIYLPVITSRP
jgi:subtilisin family serine protease